MKYRCHLKKSEALAPHPLLVHSIFLHSFKADYSSYEGISFKGGPIHFGGISATQSYYRRVRRKAFLYSAIFAFLSLLFFILLATVLSVKIYVMLPWVLLPAAKATVASMCALMAIGSGYLAIKQDPFIEILDKIDRRARARLRDYWNSSRRSGVGLERAKVEAYDRLQCLLHRTDLERGRIEDLFLKADVRHQLLAGILEAAEVECDQIVMDLKLHLASSYGSRDELSSLPVAVIAAIEDKIPDHTPSS